MTRTKFPARTILETTPLKQQFNEIREALGMTFRGSARAMYLPDLFPRLVFNLCKVTGAAAAELAEVLEVPLMTFRTWLRDHPELYVAMRDGQDLYNVERTEKALAKRAVGYECEEIEYGRVPIYETQVNEETGKPRRVQVGTEIALTKRTIKQVAPDVGAIQYLLNNRSPDRWQSVRKIEGSLDLSGKVQHQHLHGHVHKVIPIRPEDFSRLSDSQLDSLLELTCNVDPAADLPATASL